MYYNPWAKSPATVEEVRALCATESRPIPYGHLRRWDHSSVPLVWASNPVMRGDVAVSDGWDGDLPIGYNGVKHREYDDEDAMGVVPAATAPVLAPLTAILAGFDGAAAAAVATGSDIYVIRRFLRQVGCVSENIVDCGSWAGLVGYVQGRFA